MDEPTTAIDKDSRITELQAELKAERYHSKRLEEDVKNLLNALGELKVEHERTRTCNAQLSADFHKFRQLQDQAKYLTILGAAANLAGNNPTGCDLELELDNVRTIFESWVAGLETKEALKAT